MDARRKVGFLLAVNSAVLWGVSGTFGQFLFQRRGINAEWLVSVRLLLAGGALLLIASIRKTTRERLKAIWTNPGDVVQLLLFSILGMLAVQYTFFVTIQYSNAATATVLQYTAPVLIALYLSIKNRRRPAVREYVAILLAVGGTFLLVTHGRPGRLSISGPALAWGLASALAMSFYTIYPVRLLHKYHSSAVIGWSLFIGGCALCCVHNPLAVPGQWDVYTWVFTAFVIFVGALVAFYSYLTAVKWIGAQTASLLASVEPLSAALFSVLWLGTPFTFPDWTGMACILLTVFLLTRSEAKAYDR